MGWTRNVKITLSSEPSSEGFFGSLFAKKSASKETPKRQAIGKKQTLKLKVGNFRKKMTLGSFELPDTTLDIGEIKMPDLSSFDKMLEDTKKKMPFKKKKNSSKKRR